MISQNTLETLVYLRTQEVEHERKMAALAAQLPPTLRVGYRDILAHGLRVLANLLDPELNASAEHAAPAGL
jgi:hypothetical protein